MTNVLIIYGPTAIGKSAIGIEIAKKLNGEIISADSMQIYKKLNIGTAKVTEQEIHGIPHHLIDIKDVTEEYSSQEFVYDCKQKIEEIEARGKLPIIVGGTGLYIKSLIEGYNFASVIKDNTLRKDLNKKSNHELAEMLRNIDPFKKFDSNNKQRMIRYIEIAKNGGEHKNQPDSRFNFVLFCLTTDRDVIYQRINTRVDSMLSMGILEEVKYISSLHLPESNQAVKAIGYKEFFDYVNNNQPLNNCLELLKQKTRNYAKRQLTFFNQFKDKNIINVTSLHSAVSEIIKIFLEKTK